LSCIYFPGYEITDDDVVAIARLRGKTITDFSMPRCCITSVDEEENSVWVGHGCVEEDFNQQVRPAKKKKTCFL